MSYSGEFLFPPRAETKVPSHLLHIYEGKKWHAQAKKNGTCTVIAVNPQTKELRAWNREGEPHKAWGWSEESSSPFLQVPSEGWAVFVAELLHSKVPGIRDTHYVHDVLVYDGRRLLGWTYAQRYKLLLDVFHRGTPLETKWSHWVFPGRLWLARNIRAGAGFSKLFKGLKDPEDEGLVLKDPNGMLTASQDNSGWTVKCRRPHKNMAF